MGILQAPGDGQLGQSTVQMMGKLLQFLDNLNLLFSEKLLQLWVESQAAVGRNLLIIFASQNPRIQGAPNGGPQAIALVQGGKFDFNLVPAKKIILGLF